MKKKTAAGPRLKEHGSVRKDLVAWCLMIPSLILFAFFVWVPLLDTVRMSFYSVKGTTLVDFVGFENYKKLTIQPAFTLSAGSVPVRSASSAATA